MIVRYDSLNELRAAWLRVGRAGSSYGVNSSWYSSESLEDTKRLSASGNTDLVPEAENLISALELSLETPRPTWDRAPAGAFCSIPDYLSGLPTPMRRQTPFQTETGPVTILAVTTSSAGLDAKLLERRGTTILALALALTRLRPVNLQVMCVSDGYKDHTGETITTAQIDTTPLDLAMACYALTSQGFSRRLTYDLARGLNNFRGGWPKAMNYNIGPSSPYYRDLPERLGHDPKSTLIIPGAALTDKLISDPIPWLNEQIKRFTQTEEEN